VRQLGLALARRLLGSAQLGDLAAEDREAGDGPVDDDRVERVDEVARPLAPSVVSSS
jgi:hypothetical protein